jgi:hypothetical protein
MRVNFLEEPNAAEKFAVINPESDEEYERVAWADEEQSLVAVHVMRGRTMADRDGADLRLRRKDGTFELDVCHVPVRIVRRDESPWKATLLELLYDEDVQEQIRRIVRSSFMALDRLAVAREIEAVMRRQADLARKRPRAG